MLIFLPGPSASVICNTAQKHLGKEGIREMGLSQPGRESIHGLCRGLSVHVNKPRRQNFTTALLQSTVGIALTCLCHRPRGTTLGPHSMCAHGPNWIKLLHRGRSNFCFKVAFFLYLFLIPRQGKMSGPCSSILADHVLVGTIPSRLSAKGSSDASPRWDLLACLELLSECN